MLSKHATAVLLLFAAYLSHSLSRRLVQSAPTASAFESLRRLSEDSDLRTLVRETELDFGLSVRRRRGSFPDVLVTLEVLNPGANADIQCIPHNGSFAEEMQSWSSSNSHGVDYVFISTESPYYQDAILEDDDSLAHFRCRVERQSTEDPLCLVEMTASYQLREMQLHEQSAMRRIYDKCCAEEGACVGWIEMLHSVEAESENATRVVTDFDFCHVANNVCDEEGYLIKLTMDGFGLDCLFPSGEIRTFERLRKLSMHENALTGNIAEISTALESLEHLDEVALSQNLISGSLSEDGNALEENALCLLTHRSLKHLQLGQNDIEGPLPPCLFAKGAVLRDLILEQNPIGGSLPDSIPKDCSLETINLARTGLTGAFPETSVHAVNLLSLDLSFNEMTGELPNAFSPAIRLNSLSLRGNAFSGRIPDGIASSQTLETVLLDHNAFDRMPDQWLNEGPKTPLLYLDLSFNAIEEDFPQVLASLHNLTALYLNDNRFRGPLPTAHHMFPNAWVLNFSNNAFEGNLPLEWSQIGLFEKTAVAFEYQNPLLDLSNNSLAGSIPSFFLNTRNFPSRMRSPPAMILDGNQFECPETGSTAHVSGLSHCSSQTDPVYGESFFDLGAVDAGDAIPQSNTRVQTTSDSSPPEEDNDDNHRFVVVACVLGSTLLIALLLGAALGFRRYHSAKREVGSASDVEIPRIKHEPLETPQSLEKSKLQSQMPNSDSPAE